MSPKIELPSCEGSVLCRDGLSEEGRWVGYFLASANRHDSVGGVVVLVSHAEQVFGVSQKDGSGAVGLVVAEAITDIAVNAGGDGECLTQRADIFQRDHLVLVASLGDGIERFLRKITRTCQGTGGGG